MRYIALHCITLHCMHAYILTYIQTYLHTYICTYIDILLHYITLHYVTLCYATLRYITPHYSTVQYITLHYRQTDIRTYRHTGRHTDMQAYRHTEKAWIFLWIVMWSENFDLPPAKLLAAACHNESPGVRLAPSWKESNYVHTLNCSWGEQKWLQQANHQKWWTCFFVQDEIRLGFILQWEICLPIYSHQIMGKP